MSDDTLVWMNELTAEMEERRKRIEKGGGAARLKKQHEAGKLSARERVSALLDEGTFTELGVFTEHAGGELMSGVDAPGEGVVTGYGHIDGRTVFVFSQDFTVLGGSWEKCTAKKSPRSWTWPSKRARRLSG